MPMTPKKSLPPRSLPSPPPNKPAGSVARPHAASATPAPRTAASTPAPRTASATTRPLAADAAIRIEQFRLFAWTTLQLAKRGDRLAQNRLVTAALGFSLVVHAVVLAVRFVVDDERKSVSPPLEVVLVNSKSSTRPYKAELLAQANLDGGGNTDQKRRAKTPLPSIPKESLSNDLSVATQRQLALEQEARELLARNRASTMQVGPRSVEAPDVSPLPTRQDLADRLMEAMKLEAQIAREMEAYQQRPKRRFLGARAEEYRFARYVEDWRGKIERIGNLNYPEAARAQKLYGSLLLTVAIKSDGTIERIDINRSSGKKVLDAAAIRIVQLAAPYAIFPQDIRRDTDIIEITRTWTFTKGDELVAE